MRISILLLLLFPCITLAQEKSDSPFRWEEISDKSIRLAEADRPVWVYNFGPITRDDLPKTEKRRTRSCYIHPLYGLRGEILTDDFPDDHYHHHGVFWTWPHVGIHQPDGRVDQYSVWEDLGDLKQRFVRWERKEADEKSATLAVENGWFLGDEKLMIEKVEIKTHTKQDHPELGGTRAIDLNFVWIPTEKPITLRGAEEKSYGGLTVRFRPRPNRPDEEKITTITVPDGVADGDLPEKPLAWADMTSRFAADEHRSGAAIFVPPTHPDFPPTWLTRYYGPLCVGWPGADGKTFQKGEEIRLTYRLWIHETAADVGQIRKAYEVQMKEFKP